LSGVHLIEASAGTGKTYTITSLIVRAVVERAVPLERIVAVTFTNAATAELRERVGSRLEKARLVFQGAELDKPDELLSELSRRAASSRGRRAIERALGDIDKAAIFTIHGFAQRLLADFAFESGAHYDVELVGDQARLVYDAVVDFWSTRIATASVRELRWLGGPSLLASFRNIAKEAAGSADVPVVPIRPAPPVEPLFEELGLAFDQAKRAFAGQRQALGELIGLSGLNKRTFSATAVAKNLVEFESYFAGDDPFARPDAALVDRYAASSRWIAWPERPKSWAPLSNYAWWRGESS
jgi:exodeoxyribonuclease V beta subunit